MPPPADSLWTALIVNRPRAAQQPLLSGFVMITLAHSQADREDVLRLFLGVIPGIAPNAVPMPDSDHLFRPLIAQARDSAGTLIGAGLSCTPLQVAGVSMLPESMRPRGIEKIAHQTSELDLLVVHPDHRDQGLGHQIIQFLEPLLAAQGVRSWFGNVSRDLDVDRLRRFYEGMGFNVLAPGQELPPFGGHDWSTGPGTEDPAFYFWKPIRSSVNSAP